MNTYKLLEKGLELEGNVALTEWLLSVAAKDLRANPDDEMYAMEFHMAQDNACIAQYLYDQFCQHNPGVI